MYLNIVELDYLSFLLSFKLYISRKYWNGEIFWLTVFKVLTRFVMWTWFHYFCKMPICHCLSDCLSVCDTNFSGRVREKTRGRNCMKFYIWLHLHIDSCWLDFAAYRWKSSDVVWNFFYFFNTVIYNKTKLPAIVPNTNYFKLIILKFKTFIRNRKSKFIQNFWM